MPMNERQARKQAERLIANNPSMIDEPNFFIQVGRFKWDGNQWKNNLKPTVMENASR